MITLSKIAKLANVSISTASKAFSGSAEVHEETRQKVFEIAKQYGCFKKYFNSKYPKFVIAVICAYDNMAIGAMKCIGDRGLSVPADVAVLGMDDIPTAAYLDPPLSSVSHNVDDLCTVAADAMVKLLGGEAVDSCYTVPSEWHLRRSFSFE